MEASAVEFGVAHVILLTVGLGTIFFLVVWVIGVVIRLSVPERALPLTTLPVARRRLLTGQGRYVPVGLREIREDQRMRTMDEATVDYDYAGMPRRAVPVRWEQDLFERRN